MKPLMPASAHHLAQPIKSYFFQFSRGGRGAPQHRFHIESGTHSSPKIPALKSSGKVSEKGRMAPVCECWNDQAIDVGDDFLHGLAMLGWREALAFKSPGSICESTGSSSMRSL